MGQSYQEIYMAENRLNIIHMDHSATPKKNPSSSRLVQTRELQAKFERLWLIDPDQFNPLRNCLQRERVNRTWHLLTKYSHLQNKSTIDIGCGAGVFSRQLRDKGAIVTSVDIAENALKHLRQHNITHIEARQEAMPMTSLDQMFDLVICMDLLAELPPHDYRLFFAELARLVAPQGYVICSTPIDINTEGGAQLFLNLAQTELEIIDTVPSYHALYLRFIHLLEAPGKFLQGWKNPRIRQDMLHSKKGFRKWKYQINTSVFLIWLWVLLNPLTNFLMSKMKETPWILLKLEKICHFFWSEEGISHLIVIGQRRPLMAVEKVHEPIERAKKKQVWE